MFDTEKLLNTTGLFWQYPVITEKEFYNQNKNDPYYMGIPWATIIDKRVNINKLFKIIIPYLKHKKYYTCCQHIYFRKLIPLFKVLGITHVYTPHKIKGEDQIYGIILIPSPLYAVNIEDQRKNKDFLEVNFIEKERTFLYSFMGGYQREYLTDIRKKIFTLKGKDKNTCIINTGGWHFNNVVYSSKQNKEKELNIDKDHIDKTHNYNQLLLNSRYSLCPSGSGPNSIRFWESLAVGSIPVLLADTLELPYNIKWEEAIVIIKESDIFKINSILGEISIEKEHSMRQKCIEIYQSLKANYKNKRAREIVHYCCNSYQNNKYGGVERYDHQISIVFPDRVFFKGPQERNQLLDFLKIKGKDNVIVITDNHLSCDIPNEYDIVLVHHGSARKHAEREPNWNPYWKHLCCSGQDKMLYYREPNKTRIITISQFCTDSFAEYYPERYRLFEKTKILHTSELNETRFKSWNHTPSIPIVLGNWNCENKGKTIVERLSKNNTFIFKRLQVAPIRFDIKNFNIRKQNIYLESDIFLQLSLCEGFSYSALDALLCGIPVVSSNVGLFYNDIPEDCFVKIEWERNNDLDYVMEKLKYAWENKEEIGRKGREWYLKHCKFDLWKEKMINYMK